MITTGRTSARMTVTSVMLDPDGIVLSGYLLLLANSASATIHPYPTNGATRYVIDIVGSLPGAGAVLLAESTSSTRTDDQFLCDTIVRQESAEFPIVAVVRHCTESGRPGVR